MRRKIISLALVSLAFSAGAGLVLSGLQAASPAPVVHRSRNPEAASDTVRIKKFPVAVQCWTFRNFSFFETVEKVKALGVEFLQPYPGQILDKTNPDVKFDHNMSDDQIRDVRQKLRQAGLTPVSYGVVGFDNTEDSMAQVFEFARKMGIRTIVTEPEFDDYSLIESMVKKYNIQVAVHNHPLPSKYALPQTALDHIKGLDERVGVCADTGHWMRSGVNPLEALRMLEGRIIDVHLKDLNTFGDTEAEDVPFGRGKADIKGILAELTRQNFAGYLAVEHEKKDDIDNPSPPVRAGLDYITSITYYEGYDEILSRRRGRYSKAGWNHYGPGYFELDPKAGELKGNGGMGLFWYSVKTYKDFILDLEYKCADPDTNSGVFIRVPELPKSDEYIYHSFEIQINDAGEGIHKTGAAYDAEGPTAAPFNPAGEWNHMAVTCRGPRITVEINGVQVLDWQAEPRGKIRDFALEGYIGLQNHDSRSPIWFRNIFVKELN